MKVGLRMRHVTAVAGSLMLLGSINCRTVRKVEDSANSQGVAGGQTPVTVTKASETAHSGSERSVISIAAGAFVVKRPTEWSDDYSAFNLLDEDKARIWASNRPVTFPQIVVIALAEKTLLKTLEFDTASVETQFKDATAKDVLVEVSDAGENEGFQKIADVSLVQGTDKQRFGVSAEVPGRWVRLTVKTNYGENFIELPDFRAYGRQLTQTPLADVSGTYDVYFTGDFHLKQQLDSVSGCYDSRQGRVEGGLEGKAFKFTWYEKSGYTVQEIGTGIMVFSPDRQQFFSFWWGESRQRLVLGKKKSNQVGSCPEWAGGGETQLTKDMEAFGRARLYGINFDTDSDRIKDESRPTLDKVVAMLKAKPEWKLTIEGHTDSTSTPQHNQDLSERRAAAVKNYLLSAGIDGSRLKTVGFGDTKPLVSNESELGRAQNRRVELVK
jgi:outer membrane protein OmpA-like peptidoglycan-associated protein